MHQYMDTDGAADPGATQVKLEAYMIGHDVDLSQVQEVLDKAREEACAWRAQRQKQYQEWLEGACEGGMRGLYRALKTPKNSHARPYRDQSGELRPHAEKSGRRSGNRCREARCNNTSFLTSSKLVRRSSWPG